MKTTYILFLTLAVLLAQVTNVLAVVPGEFPNTPPLQSINGDSAPNVSGNVNFQGQGIIPEGSDLTPQTKPGEDSESKSTLQTSNTNRTINYKVIGLLLVIVMLAVGLYWLIQRRRKENH